MSVRSSVWAVLLALLTGPLAAGEKHFVDLSPHFTFKRAENFGKDFEGNNLKDLPGGKQTFGDSTFLIGDGVVQLGSKELTEQPERVEGIKVGQKGKQLHILHATAFGGGPCDSPTHPYFVAKGTQIGEYIVNYEGGATEGIQIIYGDDVRDWFFYDTEAGVERGKVVWTGDNDFAKLRKCRIRLYSSVWKNPHPDRVIKSIDYVGRKAETVAAPFCVGMTLETP
jgi:hypothetical protein